MASARRRRREIQSPALRGRADSIESLSVRMPAVLDGSEIHPGALWLGNVSRALGRSRVGSRLRVAKTGSFRCHLTAEDEEPDRRPDHQDCGRSEHLDREDPGDHDDPVQWARQGMPESSEAAAGVSRLGGASSRTAAWASVHECPLTPGLQDLLAGALRKAQLVVC